jgi:hypothetical protein
VDVLSLLCLINSLSSHFSYFPKRGRDIWKEERPSLISEIKGAKCQEKKWKKKEEEEEEEDGVKSWLESLEGQPLQVERSNVLIFVLLDRISKVNLAHSSQLNTIEPKLWKA